MIKWLVEEDTFDDIFYKSLIKELSNQNIEFKTHLYSPLDKQKWKNFFIDNDCVIFYGSIQFANRVIKDTTWVPGVFYNKENYKCSKYYNYFKSHLLNDPYVMIPFGDLTRNRDFLFDIFNQNKSLFIRPDRSDKIFTGQVISENNWQYVYDLMAFYNVSDNEICLISKPQEIIKEWRVFIYESSPLTMSQYLPEEKLEMNDEVLNFVQLVLNDVDFRPDLVWTMDIAETIDNQLKVLEIGSFSVAGLYACDAKIIVDAVSDAAMKEYNDYYG